MDLRISVTQQGVSWEQLVGKEHDELGYPIIVNSYDGNSKILSISEFHNALPYTTEIPAVDAQKTIGMLKILGFNISLFEEFQYSESTLYKLRGFNQAGFTYVTYNQDTQKIMIDDICEATFFLEQEKEYLITSVFSQKISKIFIIDIINF